MAPKTPQNTKGGPKTPKKADKGVASSPSVRAKTEEIPGTPGQRQQDMVKTPPWEIAEPRAWSMTRMAHTTVLANHSITVEQAVQEVIDPKSKPARAEEMLKALLSNWHALTDLEAQFTGYVHEHLSDNVRYKELLRTNPELVAPMRELMKKGLKSKTNHEQMIARMEDIIRYVGEEYFTAYLYNDMTPNTATAVWALIKFVWDSDLNHFEQVHDLVNRLRCQRLAKPVGRGVSTPTSRLMQEEILEAKRLLEQAMADGRLYKNEDNSLSIDMASLASPVNKQIINKHNQAMSKQNKEVIAMDDNKFLHLERVPDALLPTSGLPLPQIGKCEVRNRKGNLTQRKASRLIVKTIQSTSQVSPTKRARKRTSYKADGGDGEDSEDSDSPNPSPKKKTKFDLSGQPGSKENPQFIDSTPMVKQPSDWDHEESIFEYEASFGRALDPDNDTSNIREPKAFTSQQFGLSGGPPQWVQPKARRNLDLAKSLFKHPTALQRNIGEYIQSILRNFEDPNIPTMSWAEALEIPESKDKNKLRTASTNEIVDALREFDLAVVPQCNVAMEVGNGNEKTMVNSIYKRMEMPKDLMLVTTTFLRTITATNLMRVEPYAELTRDMISSLVNHFGAGHNDPVMIGYDNEGELIWLRPSLMTMDHLVDSPIHKGWLDDELITQPAKYLTRDVFSVQFLNALAFSAWWTEFKQLKRNIKAQMNAQAETQTEDGTGQVAGTEEGPIPFDRKQEELRVREHFPPYHPIDSAPVVMIIYGGTQHHWALCVLNFETKTFEILDSLFSRGTLPFIDPVLKQMGANPREWKQGVLVSQKQANLADCGYWVVANIVAYARARRAAGPQTTSGLRLWLNGIITNALLNADGQENAPPPDWKTEDMGLDMCREELKHCQNKHGQSNDGQQDGKTQQRTPSPSPTPPPPAKQIRLSMKDIESTPAGPKPNLERFDTSDLSDMDVDKLAALEAEVKGLDINTTMPMKPMPKPISKKPQKTTPPSTPRLKSRLKTPKKKTPPATHKKFGQKVFEMLNNDEDDEVTEPLKKVQSKQAKKVSGRKK